MALVNMALHLDAEGYADEADTVLELAEQQYPYPESQHSSVLHVAKNRILYKRAVRAANWAVAEQAVSFLAANVKDGEYLSAELRYEQGDLAGARDILRRILDRYRSCEEVLSEGATSGRRELLVRCLLLLANLHSASNDPGTAYNAFDL
jgi:tetratricopeptide (TPR) repeat protein